MISRRLFIFTDMLINHWIVKIFVDFYGTICLSAEELAGKFKRGKCLTMDGGLVIGQGQCSDLV